MKIVIKKSPAYLSISYKNGEFSNNLYCSNLTLIREKDKQILHFDFDSVMRSKVNSNSKDDLDYLIENYNSLRVIQIFDSTVNKKLRNYLKDGENITISIIVSKLIELNTLIEFSTDNELILNITGR